MRKNLTSVLLGFGLLLLTQADTQAQITQIQDYQNFSSAAIGTHQGINFREGGFSGLYPIPNTNGTEFWTCSDRGVNIDCANANSASCRPTYDKMYAFPSYAPKIHRIRIIGNNVQILQTITIKRPNGTGASGIINPTDLGSTAAEIASIDTVNNCADFSTKTTPKDTFGIDPEGIVVDKDGNFWLCEEGGATIWKVNPNGVLIKRYTPYANLPGVQAVDVQLDTVFKYRKNNRGFEGIAIAPNGKIYAMIQSPLLYPNKTVGEGTRIHRMIEIDPATNTQRMFAYLNDGIIGASGSNQIRLRDWKIGDMAAINDSTFLVLEAAARGTSDIKRLYQININQATVVHSGLYGSLTLEALVDSTGLANNNIKPVRKTLVMDLLANNWPAALDKAEGIAILNDSTIAISNDNDFGQFSANEDGIATATNKTCHVITYRLAGANKLNSFKMPPATTLSQGKTGLQSSANPYLTPVMPGVEFTALLTAGDTINGYRMAGTPDGTGAFDNGDGTFTLLVNHEFGNTAGVNRAHGAKGAFVSKWVINKNNLSVVSGADLISKVNLWNGTGYTLYNPADTTSKKAFNRFCSADLPPVSAFFNSTTGLGTQERIFMNGEESGNEGRAFAHIATGTNAGTTYELPALGKFSWENSVAAPASGDKTVVVGLDDATPGQVYVYVGNKTNAGNEVEKAGLTNGRLYGVAVSGLTTETSNGIPAPNTAFTLADLGFVKDSTGAAINTQSNNLGVTNFLRPEDGAWDPANPNDFYFVTTNAFSSPSRMWRLRFNDVKNPTAGGTITAVLDGTEGQKMMDNLTIDNFGNILIVEDVGNNAHLGKTWQYNTATDQLIQLAAHDSARFMNGSSSFLTQDEEASGIIDVQNILGAGNFILVDQAHYGISGEIVEGGQILKMFNPTTANNFAGAGPNSSQTPYLTPVAPGVKFTSLLTAGDAINGYRMAGTPDGAGAFDNGDGTFTLLVNHEFGNTAGVNRAHGAKGAFVSKWVINKNNLSVVSGADLISKVNLWNGTGYTLYNPADTTSKKAFNRFCSADLPAVSAFFNSTTGLGTQERIFMNGEESGNEGRAFAHIATGTNAGTTYELPALGKFSWENSVAAPASGDKTVVVGLDDATPGQVYVYVGNKTNAGNEVEKAGLTNGRLYGVAVSGLTTETSTGIPAPNTTFTLADLGFVKDSTGVAINTQSNNLGVTNFLRPEDGVWDPANPNDFYFVTTNAFSSPSRMWRLRFNDVKNPTAGGTITAVLDGTEGQKMMDNLTIDNFGNILIVEDVGNNAHLGKTWQYNTATDQLTLLASHDSTRFISGAPSFLTQDEEASGIIDVQGILGAGNFILVDQAHYGISGEIVEGGQILKMFNPATANANPEISIAGNSINIVNNDSVAASNDNTDFGSLFTGVPVTRLYTIANAGPGPLKINNISFTGAQASDFSITTSLNYPVTVAANSSLTITAKVTAQAAGTRNAYLVINNNDFDESTFRFAVKGAVTPAEISVLGNNNNITNGDATPEASDYTNFGLVKVGINQSRNFTISNGGADTLRISTITFSGPQAAAFNTNGTATLPIHVAPGSNTTIKVNAALSATGVHDANITINNNDNDEGAFTFALRANGITPEINLIGINNGDSVASINNQTDFQGVGKGYTKELTYTIQNTGTDTLRVNGIQISGAQASSFQLANAPIFPMFVLPGRDLNFGLKFRPNAAGLQKARVTVISNDIDENNYQFAVAGNGLVREISIEGNNTAIATGDNTPSLTDSTDFGQVIRGENTIRNYTIKNTGTDSLVISNINFSGNQWSDFSLVNAPALPLTVAAGSSRTITVRFTPTAVGVRSAVVNITNNDEDENNFNFAIKGEGTPASGLLNAGQNGPDAALYPNPTSANTTLAVTTTESGEATISIVDLHGREALYNVTTHINSGSNNIELPTSNLNNGIYFVSISMQGKSTIIKLAVMR